MKQLDLLPLETLSPRVKYDFLFEPLPSLSLNPKERGRPPFSRDALLKAFVYKALRRLKTLSDLAFEFRNNPMMGQAVGFDPYQPPPSIERFSQFLRETPNPLLQNIRILLVQRLLDEEIISGKHLVMDSCPIVAKIRENNLKTSVSKNRFDKTQKTKGDPDARLGILIHFPQPSKTQIRYFWGYRNHIVADAQEEIPLWEITHPADISEVHPAIPMLQKTKETFSLLIQCQILDPQIGFLNIFINIFIANYLLFLPFMVIRPDSITYPLSKILIQYYTTLKILWLLNCLNSQICL